MGIHQCHRWRRGGGGTGAFTRTRNAIAVLDQIASVDGHFETGGLLRLVGLIPVLIKTSDNNDIQSFVGYGMRLTLMSVCLSVRPSLQIFVSFFS